MNGSWERDSTGFATDAEVAVPQASGAAAWRGGCGCVRHGRRAFTGLLAGAVLAPGAAMAAIAECKRSKATKFVPAAQVEGSAAQQYRQMLQEASSKRALAPMNHPQLERLRAIAERIVPYTAECNERASEWKWEVNLIGSSQVNAFCMPGGKIAFYYGILAKLQLNDDEVAMIMGHEVAHALLEHAREQMAKNMGTNLLLRGGAALLGLGNVGDAAAQIGSQLISLKFSRTDESEADALGLVMAAKAGYDPRAGGTLWQKMMASSGGAPPAILSTHPASADRIRDIEGRLASVSPLYEAAAKPPRRFGPPAVPRNEGGSTP